MDGALLEDLRRRGLGRAARALGETCDVVRARSALDPLADANRVMRIPAAFLALGRRHAGYGEAMWEGVFDACHTRPGDHVRRLRDGAVWFVAAQERLQPVLCVRAERRLRISRPGAANGAGVNGYGGVVPATAALLASAWPASVLEGGGGGTSRAGLPGDVRGGGWRVLMAAPPGIVLRPGDLTRDDLGRSGVVASAELSTLGWRLEVRQAAT